MLGNCQAFPANALFNTRIDNAATYPVHPSNALWGARIGATRAFHADWGRNENQADTENYYGIPINYLDGGSASQTTWPTVNFTITDPRSGNGNGVPEESDCTNIAGGSIISGCNTVPAADRRFPYPVTSAVKAENGACNDARTCGDRHILVVDTNTCRLWESYFSYHVDGQWYAYSTAAYNLDSNTMRPNTWTSADAAGLPMAPLIARADEASTGVVNHALRVTFQGSIVARSYVWPARHRAGSGPTDGVPLGAALRLKSSFSIPAGWTTQAKALATAMQQYGLYVADLGSNFFVQGEPSAAWNAQTISQLQTIPMGEMEFVDMSAIAAKPGFNANSFANP